MAFSNSPELQTYTTKDLPVAFDIDFRYGTQAGSPNARKDAGTINLIPRKVGEEIHMETRPSVSTSLTVATGLTTPTVRGFYLWESSAGNGIYFIVVNQTVYFSDTAGASWTTPVTLTTNATTPVGFTEFITDAAVKMLILSDGVELYKFTYAGAALTSTKVTDADMPTPHLPFPVFLNGRLYLAKTGTGDIYNSNLNDPTAWTSGDYISSEVYPDDIQALVKVDNYILAIGAQGSEYLYDNANPSGSPLARYEGGSLPFGTLFPYTVASNKNTVILLANTGEGETSLKVIEGLKFKEATPSWLVGYIAACRSGLTYDQAKSFVGRFIRTQGDLFYSLRCPSTTFNADYGFFVFNVDNNLWTEWCGENYGSFPAYAFHGGVSQAGYSYCVSINTARTAVYLGTLNTALPAAYDTFGASNTNFPVEIRTPILTFDTMNRKAMHRFGVEVTNMSGGSVATSFTVYYNDDDNTWNSLGTLTATGTTDFPFITQLGMFRQRKLKLVYTGTTGLRFRKFQTDINKGVA